MTKAIIIIALHASAWAASDGPWIVTFRYPPQPVMLPSKCSTTCLRRQPDPWARKAEPAREDRRPTPRPPAPRPDAPAFVSGTPDKPTNDDFQEWLRSDPGVQKRRAKEQREKANEIIMNALDGDAPRTRPSPEPSPEPEEDE